MCLRVMLHRSSLERPNGWSSFVSREVWGRISTRGERLSPIRHLHNPHVPDVHAVVMSFAVRPEKALFCSFRAISEVFRFRAIEIQEQRQMTMSLMLWRFGRTGSSVLSQ